MTATKKDCSQYGQLLGELRSAPQNVQKVICAIACVPFVFMWMSGMLGSVAMVACTVGSLLIGHFVSRRLPMLCSTAQVYESGLKLNVRGKESAFDYDSLTCISSKHTHHFMRQNYIGTIFEWQFDIDGKFKPVSYQGEFHMEKDTARLVSLAEQKVSEGIEKRLLAQLKKDGELEWRPGVLMTHNGLKLVDGPNIKPREILFVEIEQWEIKDNELKVFRTGEALPCLCISNDSRNFIPMYGLFEKIATRIRSDENAKTVRLQSVPILDDTLPSIAVVETA
ncbi:MAG: hypothetical protein KDB27_09465 [Planctomycetales bacterium]|nr:hypothetical protein [Planctomycetales bacterium]